ncbi:MAG: hypothetical protein ACTHLE_25085 [Agriterribacter sp.]
MKTTDRGISWKVELARLTGEFCELHFTVSDHGWAAGENGTIYKYVTSDSLVLKDFFYNYPFDGIKRDTVLITKIHAFIPVQ